MSRQIRFKLRGTSKLPIARDVVGQREKQVITRKTLAHCRLRYKERHRSYSIFLLETGEQQIGRVPKKVKTLWTLFPKTLWPLLPKSKNCWGKLQKNVRHSFGDNSFNNLWRFVVFCYSAGFEAYTSSLVMEIMNVIPVIIRRCGEGLRKLKRERITKKEVNEYWLKKYKRLNYGKAKPLVKR